MEINFPSSSGKYYVNTQDADSERELSFYWCELFGLTGIIFPNPFFMLKPSKIDIPGQTVNFTLNGVSGNNNPDIPIIKADANNTFVIDESQSFSFTADDIDDDNIRYGIDWNALDGVDEVHTYTPTGESYIASGEESIASKMWAGTGIFAIKAKTFDDRGGESGWSEDYEVVIDALDTKLVLKEDNCSGGDAPEEKTVTISSDPFYLVACYDDGNGNLTNVTSSATWSDYDGDAVSYGEESGKMKVSPDQAGNERLQVEYLGELDDINVIVSSESIDSPTTPSTSNTAEKYKWREVAP